MIYADCIPIRAPIERFETMTSQIIRNSEANCIRSLNGVAEIFFSPRALRAIRSMADYPPLSLTIMAQALHVSKADLLGTTFYHVARKFGRSTHPQAMSRFLSEAIALELRYCPFCLADRLYYRLPWRFTRMTICPKHCCVLLDKCTHCDHSISIFKSPLKIGVCPSCGGNLQECHTTLISAAESQTNGTALADIEYLLLPQDWEPHASEIGRKLGWKLATLREESHLTHNDLVRELGISRTTIEGVEHGNFSTRGAPFVAYQKYVDFMGLSFEKLFREAVELQSIPTKPKFSKAELLVATQNAIRTLEAQDVEITGKAVSTLTGVPRGTLISHQEIADLIKQAEARRIQRIQLGLVNRARKIIADLHVQGESCTQEHLATTLGISPSKLRRSKQLMQLLRSQLQR